MLRKKKVYILPGLFMDRDFWLSCEKENKIEEDLEREEALRFCISNNLYVPKSLRYVFEPSKIKN